MLYNQGQFPTNESVVSHCGLCERVFVLYYGHPPYMSKPHFKLQHVLIIPFIVLITLSVLTTGYFAWRYSERATLELGSQISQQSTNRVREQLQGYLNHAHAANIAVKQVIKNDLIDKNDRASLYEYMQDIVHDNRKFGTLGMGYPDGAYLASGLSETGQLQKKVASADTGRVFYTYDLIPNKVTSQASQADSQLDTESATPSDEVSTSAVATDVTSSPVVKAARIDPIDTGFTKKQVYKRPDYDARVRPWYKEAIESDVPVWSSVYEMFSAKKLGITLSEALYNAKGEYVGVVGTDVVFRDLDKRLKDIQLTDNSLIFIVDDNKHVIAQNVTSSKTEALLYKVSESDNELLKQAAAYIYQYEDTKTKSQQPVQSSREFKLKGEKQNYFINFVPYAHDQGLGWYIGVVIPESDFLGNIEQIKSNTLLIWLLSFLLSLLLGVLITYWITRSIKRLQVKVKRLDYDTEQFVPEHHRIKEVDDLSIAFSEMSERLHETFVSVKQSNEVLEETISERTRELRKANNELLKLSHTDNLTQLANRRSFEELLKHNWAKLQKGELASISFMMCDLDFFKEFNDTYGHQAGDNCLQELGQIIYQSIRTTDLAARYGGEEFAIVMPDASVESAHRAATQIMDLLEQNQIPHEKSTVSDYVTITIGLAMIRYEDVLHDPTLTGDDLIARADRALYRAKSQGKNQCVIDEGSQ